MKDFAKHKNNIAVNGFTVIDHIFTSTEIETIIQVIDEVNGSNPNFRKTNDLFAIRRFFIEVPEVVKLIFNERFIADISEIFGDNYAAVKSIYFDKPEQSN